MSLLFVGKLTARGDLLVGNHEDLCQYGVRSCLIGGGSRPLPRPLPHRLLAIFCIQRGVESGRSESPDPQSFLGIEVEAS